MDIDLEIEADEVAYIYLGTDKHNNLKNLDLPDSHPIRAITGLQEVVDKVGRTEDGAEVNEIVGVKVNGAPLNIAEDRTVDVPVPTSYGYYLDLDGNNGVISLKDRDGVVLSTIDTNLERIVESGRYDPDTNELVLVLDDGSEIRIDASKLVDVYTADGETIVENGHVFALSAGSKEALKDSADHIADTSNPHGVTKEQVGLGNVDNTSDAKKPISEAMQSALNLKANDDAVVHKSGNEEIAGVKTFSNGILMLSEPAIKGLLSLDPTTSGFARFGMWDANSKAVAGFTGSTNENYSDSSINIQRNVDGVRKSSNLTIRMMADGSVYGIAPSWNVGTADNTDKILTTKMANSLPSLVHTTGNETIAGNKTFTNVPYVSKEAPILVIKSTNENKTDPSNNANAECGIYISGSDNNNFGKFYSTLDSENTAITRMMAWSSYKASLEVINKADGTSYSTAPATKDTHPDNTIVTKKWSLDKFVAKAGDTMTGGLTILMDYPTIYCKNTGIPSNSAPSVTKYSGLILHDEGSNVRGGLQICATSTGGAILITSKSSDGSKTAYLRMYCKDDGTAYADAPSWSVGTADNSDKIVTTKMANSLPSLVHTTGNETIAGEKTFTSRPVFSLNSSAGFIATASGIDWTNTFTSFNRAFQITARDKNGANVSAIESYIESNDRRGMGLNLYGKSGNACSLALKDDGTIQYAVAPATPDTAPDTAIVTKKYLLDKISALEARIATLEAKP